MDIFEYHARQAAESARPLAERMRPRCLSEFEGQPQVVGEGSLIPRAVAADRIFSMILWGPPGCGKTTLARIISAETASHFIHFSAVLCGVKDIRAVIEEARDQRKIHRRRTILFVDEIHRFNKAQQDAFLPHVESGLLTLIGATTENPSFEVIAPLLSRCRVISLERLADRDLKRILRNALADQDRGLGGVDAALAPEAEEFLVRTADGDARAALNNLELAVTLAGADSDVPGDSGTRIIGLQDVERALQQKALVYDKDGEEHYNLISALHKSLRGSDPDGALYWMQRMLAAGEDPLYICRRLVRFASEDVGNADPQALTTALNAMQAFHFLGHPEGELALAQAAVYLATAPKSNRVYTALGEVKAVVQQTGSLPVPLHIRNAPTALMKRMGYGRGYRYAHDHPEGFAPQDYLPEKLGRRTFYHPTDRGHEKTIKQRLDRWRAMKKSGEQPSKKKD
jgi:putative ATPase